MRLSPGALDTQLPLFIKAVKFNLPGSLRATVDFPLLSVCSPSR